MAKTWIEEQKAAALMIAQATSIAEAAKRTGIPAGTIKSWLHRRERNSATATDATGLQPKKMETALAHEAASRAVERAAGEIADRLAALADRLYGLAENAVGKVDVAISDGKRGATHDRDGAAWVRALVGVMAQAIDKAQLLTGKPTSRQAVEGQVRQRHEYDITERIITERPDLVDSIFAQDIGPSLADRSSSSARPGLG